jgi:hypothetical protein
VGWSDDVHHAFCTAVRSIPHGRWDLGAWTHAMHARVDDAYGRAALEAAAIDLALRQQATNLFRLAEVAAAPVRYVVSFQSDDPVAEARRHPGAELKIDADPAWDESTYARLAALGRVAVVDFKGGGDAADHLRAHRALPSALIEDPRPDAGPWPAALTARLSVDGPIVSAAALEALPARPAAVNVKPARMGGVLEALRCIASCNGAGVAVYLGGMFETGVGRDHLRVLASLFCPEGPNDIAPLRGDGGAPPRPSRLPVESAHTGFASATS